MMTDPIADLLTRIRNTLHARKERVEAPHSHLKERVVEIMRAEGLLREYTVAEVAGHKILRIWLKYDEVGQPVIRGLRRVSKPGLRIYTDVQRIPQVQRGLGISILSTSRGVLVDRDARQQRVGGEVMCAVW
jgi:small subunit ribosomal protein S8